MSLGATMGVILLPAVVPAWRVIPVPTLAVGGARASATSSSTTLAAVKTALESHDDVVEPASGVVTPGQEAPAARLIADHWPSLVAALWLAGALLLLARYMLSVVTLRRLLWRARILGGSADAALGHRLAADLHIRRPVTFLERRHRVSAHVGPGHPRVVLPAHAGDWCEDWLQRVLQHELAHVKRLDAGTQLVAGAACALFWFHPLVWHATRQMRDERERACDDRVLARGVAPSVYATDLLALVNAYGPTDRHHAALAMARRSTLEGRLVALLDPALERGAASRGHLAIALLIAILVVVPAAALRAAALTGPTVIVPAATRSVGPAIEPAPPPPAGDAAPVTTPRRTARTIHASDLFDSCPAGRTSQSHDARNPVDGRMLWTANIRSGDCTGELTAHGDVTFNRDVTGLEHISDAGDIDITTRIHGDTTRLAARASGAGAITYTFVRNGQPADFETDGRAWLASFLTTLDRHTAFAVDQRLPLFLEAGGASTALDEIEGMRTQHARLVHLVALAAGAVLADADLDRALAVVRGLTDDHFRLEGLLALARRNRFEGARFDAYLDAAGALQSAGERQRAIAAVNRR